MNARDAMPDGGFLTITTLNLSGSGDTPDRVCIAVTDTGTGMTPEVRAQAFEPFFSTKDVGKGTGLGLSQIYGFATQSGGSAEITSKLGDGTTVSILLPRAAAAIAASHAEATAEAPGGNPDEVILVVEDDVDVRRTNVESLRDLGYRVRQEGDADSALESLARDPRRPLALYGYHDARAGRSRPRNFRARDQSEAQDPVYNRI